MEKFQYLVSVIIPVYNAKKYLHKAIRSLRRQTLLQEQMEILLIDDGSTDGSAGLCDRYSERYGNLVVIHQKNAGVSAARNTGIMAARGKYIAYLDADDWISKDTLERVTSFFDAHYDETDLVGYSLCFCFPNGKRAWHSREHEIEKTAILKIQNTMVNLTTTNVVVKNRGEDNCLFDTNLQFHEDEDYELRIVSEKETFGYVKEACYYYQKGTGGATDTISQAERNFEPSVRMYLSWIERYQNNAAMLSYVQNAILNDFAWKLREGKFLPKYLSHEEYELAMSRIRELISAIDAQKIMKHPMLDFLDRFYLMTLKSSIPAEKNERDSLQVFVTASGEQDGKLSLVGMLTKLDDDQKVSLFLFAGDHKIKIPMRIRRFSWEQSDSTKSLKSGYGFYETLPWKPGKDINFTAERDGKPVEVQCYFGPDAVLAGSDGSVKLKKAVLQACVFVGKLLFPHVWLYYGCENLLPNDFEKGRKRRYFIPSRNCPEGNRNIQQRDLVFKSRKHRLLYLIAENIVLNTPWTPYIPIYEKTYLSINRYIHHHVSVAENIEN